MAAEKLPSPGGDNNKRAFTLDDHPRVVHLEGRVERVEGDVRDIKAGVQKLLDRPQFAGLTQILATLLIAGVIFGFAEWRLAVATTPISAELEKMRATDQRVLDANHAAEIAAAVLRDRIERDQKPRTP